MELIDRYTGALVGVHVGDAIGAPYETWKPQQIAADIKARGGLQFFDYDNPWGAAESDRNGLTLPAGRPTDDSDQTADLCHSLLLCQGDIIEEHLRDSLINSVGRGVSRLWDGQATGSGRTTRNALGIGARTARINGVPTNNIGTNGSLMRCAPMALLLAPKLFHIDEQRRFNPQNVREARELVTEMSAVTHDHPHSIQACWLYTIILSSLLIGNESIIALSDPDGVDPSIKDDLLTLRIGARLKDEHDFPYDPGAWPMRGTAEFSLYVALYTLMHSDSFAEGIEMAVRIGGDTDTYAAIAGALLGATYGYEAIPLKWRQTILGHDVMVQYAEDLHQLGLQLSRHSATVD